MEVSPSEMLMFVQAMQYEVKLRKAVFGLRDTTISERKRLMERFQTLQNWLSEHGYNEE